MISPLNRISRSALACLLIPCATLASSATIEILKQDPPKGSVRHGDVVYVDDGRCPAGEVKKITGGSQETGVARQVQCVKRPVPAGR